MQINQMQINKMGWLLRGRIGRLTAQSNNIQRPGTRPSKIAWLISRANTMKLMTLRLEHNGKPSLLTRSQPRVAHTRCIMSTTGRRITLDDSMLALRNLIGIADSTCSTRQKNVTYCNVKWKKWRKNSTGWQPQKSARSLQVINLTDESLANPEQNPQYLTCTA